jgi:hypothetical protein
MSRPVDASSRYPSYVSAGLHSSPDRDPDYYRHHHHHHHHRERNLADYDRSYDRDIDREYDRSYDQHVHAHGDRAVYDHRQYRPSPPLRNPDRELYNALETICSPVKTIWRETSELWDFVCYGVGNVYWRLFRH